MPASINYNLAAVCREIGSLTDRLPEYLKPEAEHLVTAAWQELQDRLLDLPDRQALEVISDFADGMRAELLDYGLTPVS
jgi:hypothetical protein